ncbi:MAG: sulfatase [Bacteroidota bacterium]
MRFLLYNFPLFIGMFCLSCQTDTPPKSKTEPLADTPNFVFILADDLGWADLGCYGSSFYETPNLDQMAAEGMRFTQAYAACPVCSPTRASIMTGKYPARIHLTDWIPGRQSYLPEEPQNRLKAVPFEQQVRLEETTLAEALKAGGYTTYFAGKWHLGTDSIYWPEHQGFDTNVGGHSKGSPPGGYFSPYDNPRMESGPEGEYLTDRLTQESVNFLDTIAERPFLLYLSFYTVHNPMQAKDSLVKKYEAKAQEMGIVESDRFTYESPWIKKAPQRGNFRDRLVQDSPVYAAMIETMDDNIGKLLAKLKEMGLEENTVVFFTSDNGGLSTSEGSNTTNAPLRAGKGWLYEGGIREPLIVKWPKEVAKGYVCSEPVTSTDFFPTMLDLSGLDLLPSQHVDGKSFRPLFEVSKSGPDWERGPLYWHYPHHSNQGGKPGGVIREGEWKLIEFYEEQTVELYNLSQDVGETNNLAKTQPEKAEELQKKLRQWLEEVDADEMQANPTYNASYMRVPPANK